VVATRKQVVKPALNAECRADAVDGEVWLWMPTGKVDLNILVDGGSIVSQEIEVTAGQVTRVEAGSELLRLTLEVPQSEYDPDRNDDGTPHLWTLQQAATDESGTRWEDYAEFSTSEVLMVRAGNYRAVPLGGGAPVEFEVREDKVVTLPEVAPPAVGSVVLKYDVSAFGTASAEMELVYQLTSRLVPGSMWVEGTWLNAALVPDGIRINGLPLETEVVIWGTIWVGSDDTDYELLLRPLKLTPTKDGQQVEAVIKRGVELHEEWFNFEARWLTTIEGLVQEIGEYAIPGRTEIAIYKDGEIAYREWITVPETSEEPFRIPDTLRHELVAREIIETDE
jgi:hypothetical protein